MRKVQLLYQLETTLSIVETFRFKDQGDGYEYEIFSILSSAHA